MYTLKIIFLALSPFHSIHSSQKMVSTLSQPLTPLVIHEIRFINKEEQCFHKPSVIILFSDYLFLIFKFILSSITKVNIPSGPLKCQSIELITFRYSLTWFPPSISYLVIEIQTTHSFPQSLSTLFKTHWLLCYFQMCQEHPCFKAFVAAFLLIPKLLA